MMKNCLTALCLLSVISGSVIAAEPMPVSAPKTFEIDVTEGAEVVFTGSVFVTIGKTVPLSQQMEIAYIESCDDSVSPISISASLLTVGKAFSLKLDETPESDAVTFDWKISKLLSMKKAKLRTCEIELPEIEGESGKSIVALQVGESIIVSSTARYKIALKRLN